MHRFLLHTGLPGAEGGSRTRKENYLHQALNLARLPIPPLRQCVEIIIVMTGDLCKQKTRASELAKRKRCTRNASG